MSLKETIALFIKERRQELGLTMEELAILIYNDPAKKGQISLYENGKRSLSLDTLEMFMKALRSDFRIERK